MSEHAAKMLGGLGLVVVGVVLATIDASGLGALIVILNVAGGAIALIGVVGAGVRAGNREVVEELRRGGRT